MTRSEHSARHGVRVGGLEVGGTTGAKVQVELRRATLGLCSSKQCDVGEGHFAGMVDASYRGEQGTEKQSPHNMSDMRC